jgi:hypothetical protein
MYSTAEMLTVVRDRIPNIPPEAQEMLAEAMAEFSAEVAAKERERCAKIADAVARKVPPNDARHIDWQSGYQDGAMEVAAAIRE